MWVYILYERRILNGKIKNVFVNFFINTCSVLISHGLRSDLSLFIYEKIYCSYFLVICIHFQWSPLRVSAASSVCIKPTTSVPTKAPNHMVIHLVCCRSFYAPALNTVLSVFKREPHWALKLDLLAVHHTPAVLPHTFRSIRLRPSSSGSSPFLSYYIFQVEGGGVAWCHITPSFLSFLPFWVPLSFLLHSSFPLSLLAVSLIGNETQHCSWTKLDSMPVLSTKWLL